MNRILAILAATILMACSLSACASGIAKNSRNSVEQNSFAQDSTVQSTALQAADDQDPVETDPVAGTSSENTSDENMISIVTTIFPVYDWVVNLLGDDPAGAKVTMLLDSGVDLHSYQPTAEDLLKIANCDLFVYVGGESDEWVDGALAEGGKEGRVVINLMEMLGGRIVEEELVEGMEEHEEEHEGEAEEGPEYDEHIWLSLQNASILVDGIADALEKIDQGNAQIYQNQALVYKEKLAALDAKYQDAVKKAGTLTILFGDRFPFRYMTEDYGLSYYAAFAGCSAETEASFETVVFLADKVDELSLKTILTIEGTDHRIAETIRDNTELKDQQILSMDSMQSITAKDVSEGSSYLTIMENNLACLREAIK